MKLPLKYFFLLLFPLILVLPLPLIASSIALGLALLNVLALSVIQGTFKTIDLKELGKNALVLFGLLVLLLDSFTNILRNLEFDLIIRDVRISFLLAPLILWLLKDELKALSTYLLFSLVIGVVVYILYAYGYLAYFYTTITTNRSFEFNHFLLYDLRENVPGAYHHSYIGMYMTFSIAILLKYAKNRFQWPLVALAFFILLNQLVLGSKLTMLLSMFLALFYLIKTKSDKRTLNIRMLVALCLILVLIVLVIYKSDVLDSVFFSASNRIESWQCALQGFFEKPIFGYGHEASVMFLENCINSNAISAHNQYLEEFMNYGLFGLWLPIFLVLIFLKSIKYKLFMSFMILITLVSFFENTLSLQRGVLFFVFFLSMFYMMYFTVKSEEAASF